MITVPLADLRMLHPDIGDKWLDRKLIGGLSSVFALGDLFGRPFTDLAQPVQRAFLDQPPPPSVVWDRERRRLESLYLLNPEGIRSLNRTVGLPRVAADRGVYYLEDGNHRCLALYLLGEATLEADLGTWPTWARHPSEHPEET